MLIRRSKLGVSVLRLARVVMHSLVGCLVGYLCYERCRAKGAIRIARVAQYDNKGCKDCLACELGFLELLAL